MAHALPVTKLASLLVKTLAKPLSKRIKHDFSRYDLTRRLLWQIGQTSHQVTSRMTIWSAGYKVRSVHPLEDEKAVSTGAEFVGETFILFVSGVLVVWEYNRSKEKERAKEESLRIQAQQERDALQAKLHTLDVRLIALEEVVKDNSQSILNILSKKKYKEPPKEEIVPIDDSSPSDLVSHGEKEPEETQDHLPSRTTKWWKWPAW